MMETLTLDYTYEIPDSKLDETVTLSYSAIAVGPWLLLTKSPGKTRIRLFRDLGGLSSWTYRDAEQRFSEIPEKPNPWDSVIGFEDLR